MPINSTYLYTDEDINTCLSVYIQQNLWGYREGCQYVLKGDLRLQGTFRDFNEGRQYVVAVLPAVGTLGESCVDYFFDKTKQAITNGYRDDRHDVFDELQADLQQDVAVKILFPYNLSNTHWLCGELKLIKIKQQITVDCYVHDPYGRGKLSDAECDKLAAAIRNRLGVGVVVKRQASFYLRRQANDDTVSCGPIVVQDIILRIGGNSLTRQATEEVPGGIYLPGAVVLRKIQLELIENYSGSAVTETTRHHFIQHVTYSQISAANTASKSASNLDDAMAAYLHDPEAFVRLLNQHDIHSAYYQEAEQLILNFEKRAPVISQATLLAILPLVRCRHVAIVESVFNVLINFKVDATQRAVLSDEYKLFGLMAAIRLLPDNYKAINEVLKANNILNMLSVLQNVAGINSNDESWLNKDAAILVKSLTTLLAFFEVLIDSGLGFSEEESSVKRIKDNLYLLSRKHSEPQVVLLSLYAYQALGMLTEQGAEKKLETFKRCLPADASALAQIGQVGTLIKILPKAVPTVVTILGAVGVAGALTTPIGWGVAIGTGVLIVGGLVLFSTLKAYLKERKKFTNSADYFFLKGIVQLLPCGQYNHPQFPTAQQTFELITESFDVFRAAIPALTEALYRHMVNGGLILQDYEAGLKVFSKAIEKTKHSRERQIILKQLHDLQHTHHPVLQEKVRQEFVSDKKFYQSKNLKLKSNHWYMANFHYSRRQNEKLFTQAVFLELENNLQKFFKKSDLSVLKSLQKNAKDIKDTDFSDQQSITILTWLLYFRQHAETISLQPYGQATLSVIEKLIKKIAPNPKQHIFQVASNKLITFQPGKFVTHLAEENTISLPEQDEVNNEWQKLYGIAYPALQKAWKNFNNRMNLVLKKFCDDSCWNWEKNLSQSDGQAMFNYYYQSYCVPAPMQLKGVGEISLEEFAEILIKQSKAESPTSPVYIMRGTAGAGKSLSMHYLAQLLWEQQYETRVLPVLIQLKELNSPNDNDEVEKKWREALVELNRRGYKLIFLLDGYDECNKQATLAELLRSAGMGNYSGTIVMSCRDELVQQQGAEWLKKQCDLRSNFVTELSWLELEPFGLLQINQYGDKLAQVSKNSSTQLIKSLRYYYDAGSTELKHLLQTPLGLKMGVSVFHNTTHPISLDKTISRYDFYKLFFTDWLRKERKHVDLTIEMLEQIAITMCLAGTHNRLSQQQLKLMNDKTATATYKKMQEKMFSPIWGANTQKQCYFKHQSFYEFLVANAIVNLFQLDKKDELIFEANFSNNVTQNNPLNKFAFSTSNRGLLCNDGEVGAAIIRFLAERTRFNDFDKACWFKMIEYSKKQNSKHPPLLNNKEIQNKIKAIAANAITLLNRAGVNFLGCDLSGVRIKGADLSYAVMPWVDLQNANLKNVQLQQTYLPHANLNNTKLNDVVFDERAYLTYKGAVNCLAYSPDGKYIALGGKMGGKGKPHEILIFDWHTGALIQRLAGQHTDWINCLSYIREGKELVSGSGDGNLCIWDLETVNCISKRSGGGGGIKCLAYHNSDKLVFASEDKQVRFWNFIAEPQVVGAHTKSITCVTFHPNGNIVASAGEDNAIRLWDLKDPSNNYLLTELPANIAIESLAFSCTGETLASGSRDNLIRVWDSNNKRLVKILSGHDGWVRSLAFHPYNKNQLASGGLDNTVRLWDIAISECKHVLQGFRNRVRCVAYHPDGSHLASGSEDSTARLWDLQNLPMMQGNLLQHSQAECLAYHPETRQCAVGSRDKSIRLWEIGQTNGAPTLHDPQDWVVSLAFNPMSGSKQLASGSRNGKIYIWDLAEKKCIAHWQAHHGKENQWGWAKCLAYHPLGEKLVSGGWDNMVRVWDLKKNYQAKDLQGHTNLVWCVAYNSLGTILASGSNDKTIILWDMQAERSPCILKGHHDGINYIAWHPDNLLLASGSEDHTVRIWNTQTGTHDILSGHTAPIIHLAYILQGRYLISWDKAGHVILWNMITYKIVDSYYLHPLWQVIYTLGFLVTSDLSGGMSYWQAPATAVNINAPKLPRWKLQTMTRPVLDASFADFTDAKGLTARDKRMLQQRGAEGVSVIKQQRICNPKNLPPFDG